MEKQEFNLPEGLVSWWSFNYNTNDPVSGNDALTTHNIKYAASNKGIIFDPNQGSYIAIPYSESLNNQVFTIETWVEPKGKGKEGPNDDLGYSIFQFDDKDEKGADKLALFLSWSAKDKTFVLCVEHRNTKITSTNNYPENKLYHVVVSYDSRTFKLYVNGKLDGSLEKSFQIPYSKTPLTFGSTVLRHHTSDWSRIWNGSIATIRIYKNALTAEKILKLYNHYKDNIWKDSHLDTPAKYIQARFEQYKAQILKSDNSGPDQNFDYLKYSLEHPVHHTSNPPLEDKFAHLQATADHWLIDLPGNLKNNVSLKEIVKSSFKDSIEEMSTQKVCMSGLKLDMQVINKTFSKLTESEVVSKKEVKMFADHAKSVINAHASQATALAKQLNGLKSNPLVAQIGNLPQTLKAVEIQVDTWTQSIANVGNFSMSKSLENTLNQVTNFFHGTPDNAVEVATTVFDKFIKALPHTDQPVSSKSNLKADKDLTSTAKQIGQGIDLVGSLMAGLGVKPEVVHQVVTIAKAGVAIVECIGSIAIGIASGSLLGPIGTIGGAVVSLVGALVNIFGNMNPQPSAEQQMLTKISEQICKLGQHLDKRLDHIEKMLVTTYEHTMKRFDILESILDKFYADTMKEFRQLRVATETITFATNIIQKQVSTVDRKLTIAAHSLYLQDYNTLKAKALDVRNLTKVNEYAQDLKIWSTIHAKDSLLTNFTGTNDLKNLLQNVTNDGIPFSINALASHLGYKTILVNPLIWAECARVYMNMIYSTADITIDWNYQKDINEIIKEGQEIYNFINFVRSNAQLFSKYCHKYQDHLNTVLKLFQKISLADNVKSNTEIKHELDELEANYQMLIILSHLAFELNRQNNEALFLQLHVEIFDKNDLSYLMSIVTSKKNKLYIIDFIRDKAITAINNLNTSLLIEVKSAKVNQSYTHPMIEKIIRQLKTFQPYYLPSEVPLVNNNINVTLFQPSPEKGKVNEFTVPPQGAASKQPQAQQVLQAQTMAHKPPVKEPKQPAPGAISIPTKQTPKMGNNYSPSFHAPNMPLDSSKPNNNINEPSDFDKKIEMFGGKHNNPVSLQSTLTKKTYPPKENESSSNRMSYSKK